MFDNINNEESSAGPNSIPQTKQRRKKIIVVLAVIVGILLLASIFLFYHRNPDETFYTLNGYRYTVIYTTHTPLGNSTITNHKNSDTWTVRYQLNSTFSIDQPFYNNVSGGTTTVSNIQCDTPGFTFSGSSKPFPFTVPTALNASTTNNNIIVRLTFDTPSAPYSGPLVYTAYFEYYP